MLKKSKPQWKAVCLAITTMSPKKPNSANRRIAKVNATSLKQNMAIKIPGEGHSLQQHSIVLVKKGKVRDLNGVSSIAIRGKYDLSGVANRKNSRSRYGTKVAT